MVAVVTGGASGIGRATAIALAREGADLVLADIDDARLKQVRREIAGLGRKAVAVHADVSKLDAVQNLFDRSMSEMGRVDILMNNAGVHLLGPAEKISIADWEWIVGINLWGVVYGINVFLPHMLDRGNGHIVNTASMSGLIGAESSIPYVATKFAVVGISECLAAYLRPKGIGVTVLCPGFVATNIVEHERLVPFGDGFDDARRAFLEALKRGEWSRFNALPGGVVSPDEVAGKVVRAIKENTFLVYTHPGHKEAVVGKAQDPEGAVDLLAALHLAWDNVFKLPAAE
jgi:NAD(P)-dependent dehydrogenase (short-subunit alcohol dehydrogenase family)